MGIETGPRNEFRDSLRPDRGERLVIAEKRAKGDPSAEGLGAVRVPRSEIRRTDQRGGDRHPLAAEQIAVRRGNKSHAVKLLNLSHGGAMVEGDFKARLWDKAVLVLGDEGEIECAVRWIKDGKVGLEFAHETQVDCDPETLSEILREVIHNSFPDVRINARTAAAADADADDQKRGAPRHPLIWNGVLYHGFEWQAVRLRNVSASGAMIECADGVPDGAAVFLDLQEAGRIAARVSWSRGDQTGLLFDQPFKVASLSKATPVLASKTGPKSHFAPYGRECDQSPWAPEWKRLSIAELGAELGG